MAILGDDLDLDDLDAPLPLRDTRRSGCGPAEELDLAPSCCSNSANTFCRSCGVADDAVGVIPGVMRGGIRWGCTREGTGEAELVGVWVREALREDLRVSGDWSMRCFHSSRRFMDSSR